MNMIKNYFKKKSIITALLFILIGSIFISLMPLIPHGPKYVRTATESVGTTNYQYDICIEFIGGKKLKTYKKRVDTGEIDNLQIVPYTIEDGVLYKNGEELGEIDIYKIKTGEVIVNDKKSYIGYDCKSAIITSYVSYAFVAIGALIIILPIFFRKKKKTKN